MLTKNVNNVAKQVSVGLSASQAMPSLWDCTIASQGTEADSSGCGSEDTHMLRRLSDLYNASVFNVCVFNVQSPSHTIKT